MVFKCIDRVNDVLSFKVFADSLLYVVKSSNSLFLNKVLLDQNVEPGSYIFKCGKVLYSKNKAIYYDNGFIAEKSLLIQKDHSGCEGLIVMGDYELINYAVAGDYEYLNIQSGAISHISRLQNITYILLSSSQVFFASKSEIYSLSVPNPEKLSWRNNLAKLCAFTNSFKEKKDYEIRQFIGVHKDQLIVQLTDATLLFLNIGNGSKVHTLHLNESHPFKKNSVYDDDYPPHLVDDKLIWLNRQRLLEIDLNTYDIEIKKDYSNVPKKEQFRFMHSTHFEGKIYFVADYGWQYVTPSRVGVMDGNTGEIIWEQQLEKTGGLPEAPKVTSDKLFIRTAKGELYIFEKSDFST
jgi:hypothetical protein